MNIKNKKTIFLVISLCLSLSAAFLFFANNTPMTHDRAETVRSSANDFKVAILNSDNGYDYSGWRGGNDNPYDRVQQVLDDRGYTTTIITNDDLVDGESLYNMGIDVLILPDNGPTDTAANAIGEWNRNYDGHIVSMDSSVVVLFYEGLITGEIHYSNYYDELWGYGTDQEGKIIDSSHPIMGSYSLNEEITGKNYNCEFYNSSMNTELGSNAEYFHPLVSDLSVPDNIYVAAFDFPNQGRLVQIWDQYPEDDTHDTENLFVGAVDWVYSGGESARPDLDVSFISAPSEGETGATVSYDAKIENIGTESASNVNFYLDIEGSTEASQTGFSLNPGETSTLSVNYTLPSSGSISISAHCDSVSGETILNNNEISTSTSIVSDPAPFLSYDSSIGYFEGTTGNNAIISTQDDDPNHFRYNIDDATWSDYISWSNDESIEINIDDLSRGYHQLLVEVYDDYGSYSTATIEINVEEYSDTNPPTIDDRADITVIEGYTGESITWEVSDAHPDNYSITCNGEMVVSNNEWSTGNITYEISDGKEKGDYVYEIIIEDESGNSNSDTVQFSVVDESIPSISQPENITVDMGYTGESITWEVSDAHPDNYSITCNGEMVVSNNEWSTGNITYEISDGKEKGDYVYEIIIEDESGNSNTDTVKFSVEENQNGDFNFPNMSSFGLGMGVSIMMLSAIIAAIFYKFKKG